MVELEDADDVGAPRRDGADGAQADDAGDDAEGVKGRGDGENAKTELGLHHEGGGAEPAYIAVVGALAGIRHVTKDGIVCAVGVGRIVAVMVADAADLGGSGIVSGGRDRWCQGIRRLRVLCPGL
jgi:hypothetical protein